VFVGLLEEETPFQRYRGRWGYYRVYKWGMVLWTVFVLGRIEFSVRLSWARERIFRFHKRWLIFLAS
jgi:hypothetical protein